MLFRVNRCSTDIRNFPSKQNVVQRHSTPDETGAVRVLTAQGQGRRQKLSPNHHIFKLPNAPEK